MDRDLGTIKNGTRASARVAFKKSPPKLFSPGLSRSSPKEALRTMNPPQATRMATATATATVRPAPPLRLTAKPTESGARPPRPRDAVETEMRAMGWVVVGTKGECRESGVDAFATLDGEVCSGRFEAAEVACVELAVSAAETVLVSACVRRAVFVAREKWSTGDDVRVVALPDLDEGVARGPTCRGAPPPPTASERRLFGPRKPAVATDAAVRATYATRFGLVLPSAELEYVRLTTLSGDRDAEPFAPVVTLLASFDVAKRSAFDVVGLFCEDWARRGGSFSSMSLSSQAMRFPAQASNPTAARATTTTTTSESTGLRRDTWRVSTTRTTSTVSESLPMTTSAPSKPPGPPRAVVFGRAPSSTRAAEPPTKKPKAKKAG